MFSLDNFYYVLHANFLQPYKMVDLWFSKFDFRSREDLHIGNFSQCDLMACNSLTYFYDQEPLIPEIFNRIAYIDPFALSMVFVSNVNKILANSEHSEFKKQICRDLGLLDWYYFFHGLAALEWYRDFKYVPKTESKFTKVFISLNHLVTKDRSYRLFLVSKMMEQGLLPYGHVSCQLSDANGSWRDEILSQSSKLPKNAKKLIYQHFSKLDGPLELDISDGSYSQCSARLNLPLQQSALWHVVTETVFYYEKLHLTEKIFKPIVARRPFILVAAPGNLAYLKSYGFKTFDKWIDESYDLETDHEKRISMIVAELDKLCKLSESDLQAMYEEMQSILDFNFDHFYGNFKAIVVKEMIDNFEKCLKQANVGAFPEMRLDVDRLAPQEIYSRLMQ